MFRAVLVHGNQKAETWGIGTVRRTMQSTLYQKTTAREEEKDSRRPS